MQKIKSILLKRIALEEQRKHYDQVAIKPNLRNTDHYLKIRWQAIINKVGRISSPLILDVGCGEGILFEYLKKEATGCFYVGLDPSLRRSFEKPEKNQIACFVNGIGEELPFKDKSFDLVFCNALLHHLPDTKKLMDEAVRVCRHKGYVAFIEPNRKHPLIIGLAIWKKHERGALLISEAKIANYMKKMDRVRSVVIQPINSYCYPYQTFPPNSLFPVVVRLERSLNHPPLSTHFLMLAQVW
jgi:ubiquinone/menaquinone biosynthesis C-methylase UbiE